MHESMKIKVLFVCMGNICRSPTAEGAFRRIVAQSGMESSVFIDSAGTHDYHVGAPPDRRAQSAAAGRGYDISGLRGRLVSERDCAEFDYILAMDADNLANLQRLCPARHRHKLHLFLTFSARYPGQEVPDPYYGGSQGFETVLDMVEDASHGLLAALRTEINRS
jgi:protein-tyrosine phosphatase